MTHVPAGFPPVASFRAPTVASRRPTMLRCCRSGSTLFPHGSAATEFAARQRQAGQHARRSARSMARLDGRRAAPCILGDGRASTLRPKRPRPSWGANQAPNSRHASPSAGHGARLRGADISAAWPASPRCTGAVGYGRFLASTAGSVRRADGGSRPSARSLRSQATGATVNGVRRTSRSQAVQPPSHG